MPLKSCRNCQYSTHKQDDWTVALVCGKKDVVLVPVNPAFHHNPTLTHAQNRENYHKELDAQWVMEAYSCEYYVVDTL